TSEGTRRSAETDGTYGLRASPAARRPRAELAFPAHGAALARDHPVHRDRVRACRGAETPVGPVLVPGFRLRARFRLALERPHDDRVRCDQGGAARDRE